MNNWTRFEKALKALSPNTSDALNALYGPPEALSGQSEMDTTPPDAKRDEGYWQSILSEGPR